MPSVRVTLTSQTQADAAREAGAQGAGLVCLESLVLDGGVHPRALLEQRGARAYAELLSAEILAVCQTFAGYPVWVRTLDFRSPQLAGLGHDEPADPNPALGWRGIRRDLAWPEHHAAQWLAFRLAQEAGADNLGVLLPMVHDAEQVRAAQWMRDGAGLGDACGLGILIETPAAALCIETFLEAGVDGVAFHVDHLAELILGIDRNHPRLGNQCDSGHPAVLRLVGGAAAVCAQAGVETSVCGAGPGDPALAVRFLELGVDAISCAAGELTAVLDATTQTPWNVREFYGWNPGPGPPE